MPGTFGVGGYSEFRGCDYFNVVINKVTYRTKFYVTNATDVLNLSCEEFMIPNMAKLDLLDNSLLLRPK